MNKSAGKIQFQEALMEAMRQELRRGISEDVDGIDTMNRICVILTYHACQCCEKTWKTKKSAREVMRREVERAFKTLKRQAILRDKNKMEATNE